MENIPMVSSGSRRISWMVLPKVIMVELCVGISPVPSKYIPSSLSTWIQDTGTVTQFSIPVICLKSALALVPSIWASFLFNRKGGTSILAVKDTWYEVYLLLSYQDFRSANTGLYPSVVAKWQNPFANSRFVFVKIAWPLLQDPSESISPCIRALLCFIEARRY